MNKDDKSSHDEMALKGIAPRTHLLMQSARLSGVNSLLKLPIASLMREWQDVVDIIDENFVEAADPFGHYATTPNIKGKSASEIGDVVIRLCCDMVSMMAAKDIRFAEICETAASVKLLAELAMKTE